MQRTKEEALEQIELALSRGWRAAQVIESFNMALDNRPERSVFDDPLRTPSIHWTMPNEEVVRSFVTGGMATIERIASRDSEYYRAVSWASDAARHGDHGVVVSMLSALRALKESVEKGWLVPIEQRIRVNVYDDLLVQATELETKGYHVAAMVLAGGVLEQHLQKMCSARSLAWKGNGSMSAYNDVLRDVAYPQPKWRRIQQIADLRNEAAHGKGAALDPHDVADALKFVGRFIEECSA